MHDPTEYPGFPRQDVWYVDEQIPALETRFSPIFDIDRSMGITAAVPAPTGATAAGNPDHLFRTIPIGNRLIVCFTETEVFVITAPTFQLWVSCSPTPNPITERLLASIAIPIGGTLALDSFQGFPYLQARIVNNDAEGTVTICGAFRVTPF